MKSTYLYANEKQYGKYIVFKVEVDQDFFLEERRARTMAKMMGLTLAGGSFAEDCLPYNFKSNYIVYIVPSNLKPSKPTAKDIFIDNLIEFETNGLPEDKETKFLRKANRMGLHQKIGGLK